MVSLTIKVRRGEIMLFDKLIKLLPVNLRLFDDAGGGDAGAGDSSGSTGEAQAGIQLPGQGTALGTKKKGDDKKPVVLYGKQDQDSNPAQQHDNNVQDANAQPQKTPEQLKAEYEMLRRGEFKQFFDQEIQNIINKRFRNMKTLENQIAAMNPIIDVLAEKYGTDDVNVIANRLRQDSLQELADAAGMTVEQYEQIMKLRQENKMLKKRQETLEAEQKINAQVLKWQQEAETMKAKYPNFDLRTELQNENFVSLLRAGVSVEAAYQVCHMDEIIAGTAKQAQNNVVENIKAKGNRPKENATNPAPGIILKSDPRNLTREDREEIARRVARGEVIRF